MSGPARAGQVGLWAGLLAFVLMLALPAPGDMPLAAWRTCALVVLMATWWMTQALPLTATALLPFLAFPLMGVMGAGETAGAYYSPILFLVLGGAMIALAIERTGLHRRLALAIVSRGAATPGAMLLAFMAATAVLSMIVSNTATTLIMMPIAIAVLRAASIGEEETDGFAGALVIGIAFSASIGGLGTLVGSPTNAIAAGIIRRLTGADINFLTWASYGLPLVAATIPLAWLILKRVQRVSPHDFDAAAARSGIGEAGAWSTAEQRLVPLVVLVVAAWVLAPLAAPYLPADSVTDGTIAIAGALLLFIIPDGSGRPLLVWKEADRAPWGVIMMFGGGLALASGISTSGLAQWIGTALEPIGGVHPVIIALLLVAMVIVVTEFASNVASASSTMPVVAGLVLATGADPVLLAMPAAIAASWAFMLPSGTGPNAIAWATGHVALPRLLKAGLIMNLIAPPLIVGIVWMMRSLIG
ncbi:MAG TPA: DASS family sodium-coupled anion symporter [Sphingomicrobium sp.]|nr:DASS family sodium-coupled anion symporter [Sphingomicrobium sp.]